MRVQIIPQSHDNCVRTTKMVAVYARVSKEDERLAHSLEAQIEHYRDIICEKQDWICAGIYSDDFVTGTTDSRSGFQGLMEDCRKRKIDIVLCKSVSRFSRNTVDLLSACRELSALGIDVRFEKEGLSTMSDTGELMLSLLASFAQEESRSISENIKWGIRKGFEVGHSAHYKLYGYAYNGSEYVIVPKEAEVVKRIYDTFLSGGTAEQLEKAFSAENIKGPKGGAFKATSIRRLLINVTYTGNTVLQREYIDNHITHKRMKNNGELARYIVEKSHPVIIPQEKFDAVQAELARRALLGKASEHYMSKWSTRKLYCGACGSSLRYSSKAGKDGQRIFGCFVCNRKFRKGAAACDLRRIPEKAFKQAFSEAVGCAEFSEDLFSKTIERVTAYNERILYFELNDGRKIKLTWR